jgi:hypothetical protein
MKLSVISDAFSCLTQIGNPRWLHWRAESNDQAEPGRLLREKNMRAKLRHLCALRFMPVRPSFSHVDDPTGRGVF